MELDEMLEKIRSGAKGRERVARTFYVDEKLQNGIRKVIGNLGGSEEDFSDVFNFSVVQMMKNVLKDKSFTISSNVHSYLFGIARNVYLQNLRKQKIHTSELTDQHEMPEESTIDLVIMQKDKKNILVKVLNTLGKNCRAVLLYWSAGYKMAEIASLLNYSSDVVVRRKKMNCLQDLLKYLDKHPETKKLLAE